MLACVALAASAQPTKPGRESSERDGLGSLPALQRAVSRAKAAAEEPQAEKERRQVVVRAREVLEDIWRLQVRPLSGEQKLLTCYTGIRALAAAEQALAESEHRKAVWAVRSEAETLAQAYDGRPAAFATLYEEACWYYWREDYPSATKRLHFILSFRDASPRRPALATLGACHFKANQQSEGFDALLRLGQARNGDPTVVVQGIYVAALELLGRAEHEKGRDLLASIRAMAPDERAAQDAAVMLRWVDRVYGVQKGKKPK
jgi:hypothetical protein